MLLTTRMSGEQQATYLATLRPLQPTASLSEIRDLPISGEIRLENYTPPSYTDAPAEVYLPSSPAAPLVYRIEDKYWYSSQQYQGTRLS
ncbi:MAG TPA: hypothetical protein VGL77_06035 [Armatimonadota bacterium]|jgi:hypothetical protein